MSDDKGQRVRNLLDSANGSDVLLFHHFFGVPGSITVRSVAICGSKGRRALKPLAELPDVEFVSVLSVPIDESVISDLANLKQLKKIQFVDCGVTDSQLQSIRARLPGCLVVNGAVPITDQQSPASKWLGRLVR